jgi:Ser/Thr protein kinase RdoA (MazF antagonist)
MAREKWGTLLTLAYSALDYWDLNNTQIELISVSENLVYRVEDDRRRTYALRIHRPNYRTLAELKSEQLWSTALNQSGVSVPVQILSRDGQGYAKIVPLRNEGTRYASVVNWVEGETLASLAIKEPDKEKRLRYFEQLGHIAARIHNQATSWKLPTGFKRHSFDANGLVGEAPLWGNFWEVPQLTHPQRKLIRDTRSRIFEMLLDYDKDPNLYSLIHSDLSPYNILVNNDNLHVIDFDDAGFGWHQYELAGALYRYQRSSDFFEIQNAVICGYRKKRVLSDKAIGMLPIFLLIRALVTISWIHNRPNLKRNKFLTTLIESACTQIESLKL